MCKIKSDQILYNFYCDNPNFTVTPQLDLVITMGLHEKKVFRLKIDSAMFDIIPLRIEIDT